MVVKPIEDQMNVFENKVICRLYGHIIKIGEYKERKIQEIYQLFHKNQSVFKK